MSVQLSIFLGGYDAKSCPEKTRKTYAPEYKDVLLDPVPPGDLYRMEAGQVFEKEILKTWLEEIGSDKIIIIPDCDRSVESKKNRENLTREAMQNPGKAQVIWNARLTPQDETHRTGEPDALVRYNSKGNIYWLPVDVKDHNSLEGTKSPQEWPVSDLSDPTKRSPRILREGTPNRNDALQLAHYNRMLSYLGNDTPAIGGIIGRDRVILWHDLEADLYRHAALGLTSALSYYNYEFAKRVEIAKSAVKGKSSPSPEWKTECLSCQFRTVCKDELLTDFDHITLLAGVTPDRARIHYSKGVSTIKQLAHLDYDTAAMVDKGADLPSVLTSASFMDPDTLIKDLVSDEKTISILDEHGLKKASDVSKIHPTTASYSLSKVYKLSESIDKARVRKAGKVFRARGVNYVNLERTTREHDIDIEDYNGFVYLIGVRDTERKKKGEDLKVKSEYKSFATWDHSDESEARIFAEFWEYINSVRNYAKSNKNGYRLYYYSKHEPSTFKALARKHVGREGVPTLQEVCDFFDHHDSVDMHPLLTTQLIWPTESTTLKELAKWVRFSWRDTDPSGGNSLAWYNLAITGSDEEKLENQKRLLEYNADDVHAQLALRDWLTRLGEARSPGHRLPSVEDLTKRFRPR